MLCNAWQGQQLPAAPASQGTAAAFTSSHVTQATQTMQAYAFI